MTYVIIAVARGDGNTVKLATSSLDEPGPNEQQKAKAQASGVFRVMYGEWAQELGVRVRKFDVF